MYCIVSNRRTKIIDSIKGVPEESEVIHMSKKEKISAREFARRTGYSYRMILAMCAEGTIPAIKRYGYWIDPNEALEALEIKKREKKPTAKENRRIAEQKQALIVSDQKKLSFRERLALMQKARGGQ